MAILKLIKEHIDFLNESYVTNTFTLGTAGYILEDGSFVVVNEYHGEENTRETYPEYSNTHPEEDTCVRIYETPNDIQYKKIEEIIDRYLEKQGYCKIEIWNKTSRRYSFYKVFSLYEYACEDSSWEEQIGNWTGYKLVQIIKNNLNNKLNEVMRGKRSITNTRIARYVAECIGVMKNLRFGFPNEAQLLTYDDIDIEEGNATEIFGSMLLPRTPGDNFKLVLNQYMFTEPEDIIKNTIYHELCHYVVDKLSISLEVTYYRYGKWYYNKDGAYDINDFKGHGYKWKRVAAIVGKATGQNITTTGSFDRHTGVGEHAKSKYNYIVRCKHCAREFKYAKKSKFVAAVLAGNGHVDRYWCVCPDGHKGHDFEILKGQ